MIGTGSTPWRNAAHPWSHSAMLRVQEFLAIWISRSWMDAALFVIASTLDAFRPTGAESLVIAVGADD